MPSRYFHLMLVVALSLVASCATVPRKLPVPKGTTTLRVALFPYIPKANAALAQRLEREFEAEHSNIDLVLSMDANADYYGLETLTKWLGPKSDPSNGNGYDVVEVDMVLLGDLVREARIAPWAAPPYLSSWHSAARSASTQNGILFGVPHYLCTWFMFTRDLSVARATTAKALFDTLEYQASTPPPRVPPYRVATNLVGSYTTGSFYLNMYAQEYGAADVAKAMTATPDERVMTTLVRLDDNCTLYDGNTRKKDPCLDQTYKSDSKGPFVALNDGSTKAAFGYSEMLNTILATETSSPVYASISPLGAGNKALVFADSLVLNSRCNDRCQWAATAFAEYLLKPTTYEWLLLARDQGPHAVPRYLIPAVNTAYESVTVNSDVYYRIIRAAMSNVAAYPSDGFPAIRNQLRTAILEKLPKPPQP
jgi:thiamine pyridinylase